MSNLNKKSCKMKRPVLLALIAAVFCGCAEDSTPDDPAGELVVTFIDVGQGDAALLELPGGETILIDGGDNGHGVEDILPILGGKDIATIDLVVLSHPHADHCGGLDEVLGVIDALEIWENGEESDSATYRDWAAARDGEGAEVVFPVQDHIRYFGDVAIEVLNSDEGYPGANNDSLVLKISYGSTDFLFTGDIEEEEDRDLVADYSIDLESEVIKVPHHGSANFDPGLIDAVTPTHAIISTGEGNSHGHPSPEAINAYLEAGAQVLRTDILGNIVAKSDGSSIRFDIDHRDVATK